MAHIVLGLRPKMTGHRANKRAGVPTAEEDLLRDLHPGVNNAKLRKNNPSDESADSFEKSISFETKISEYLMNIKNIVKMQIDEITNDEDFYLCLEHIENDKWVQSIEAFREIGQTINKIQQLMLLTNKTRNLQTLKTDAESTAYLKAVENTVEYTTDTNLNPQEALKENEGDLVFDINTFVEEKYEKMFTEENEMVRTLVSSDKYVKKPAEESQMMQLAEIAHSSTQNDVMVISYLDQEVGEQPKRESEEEINIATGNSFENSQNQDVRVETPTLPTQETAGNEDEDVIVIYLNSNDVILNEDAEIEFPFTSISETEPNEQEEAANNIASDNSRYEYADLEIPTLPIPEAEPEEVPSFSGASDRDLVHIPKRREGWANRSVLSTIKPKNWGDLKFESDRFLKPFKTYIQLFIMKDLKRTFHVPFLEFVHDYFAEMSIINSFSNSKNGCPWKLFHDCINLRIKGKACEECRKLTSVYHKKCYICKKNFSTNCFYKMKQIGLFADLVFNESDMFVDNGFFDKYIETLC